MSVVWVLRELVPAQGGSKASWQCGGNGASAHTSHIDDVWNT